MLQIDETFVVDVVLQGPELRRQSPRRRLQQGRYVKMIGAEPQSIFAQDYAGFLVQRLDVLGDFGPLQNTQRFNQLERDAAGDAGNVLRRPDGKQRPQQLLDI